jgi:hypothetical protein
MHSGEPFSRAAYAAKLKPPAQVLVDRFFPLPATALGSEPAFLHGQASVVTRLQQRQVVMASRYFPRQEVPRGL